MKPLLVILNPREVPAFEASVDALGTDTCRIRGCTEGMIEREAWPLVMASAKERGYTHLSLISDDTIIPKHSWELVLEHSRRNPDVFATAWCNQDMELHQVALSTEPLTDEVPGWDSYSMPTWRDVLLGPAVQFTYFTGFCLTTAPVSRWESYPYMAFGEPGYSADYHLSQRLHSDGIAIECLRDAFVLHLRETSEGSPNSPELRLLLDEQEPEVLFSA